jgi:hypothetical protein
MRYSQITIFILFALLTITYITYVCLYGYTFLESITLYVNGDDLKNLERKTDITLQGKVVLDKDAGVEVARGIAGLGSNIGLAGCVGTLAAGTASVIAKSSLPPVQKVGLVLFSGVAGAVIQTGANAINAQRFTAGSTDKISSTNNNISLPKDINKFIDYPIGDSSPLETLLQCIFILDFIALWSVLFLSMQFMFRFIFKDKPELKNI